MCRSGLSQEFVELAKAGQIEAWNLPLGIGELFPKFQGYIYDKDMDQWRE